MKYVAYLSRAVVGMLLFMPEPVLAADVSKLNVPLPATVESAPYAISARTRGLDGGFELTILKNGSEISTPIPLAMWVNLDKLFVAGANVIAIGDIGTHEVFAAVSLETGKLVREEFASSFSISPSKRYLAHQSFYPAHFNDSQYNPYVCLVDFESETCESVELHPSEKYDPKSEFDRIKKWSTASKIVWRPDSSAIVWLGCRSYLVAPEEEEYFVVAVDFSDGVSKASVFPHPILGGVLMPPSESDHAPRPVTESIAATEKGLELKYRVESPDTPTKVYKTGTISMTWKQLFNEDPIDIGDAP